MARRSTVVTIVAVLALTALLLYSTLASQTHECSVIVEFRGRSDSATVSAASEKDAASQAQTTACGTIAQGMDESIACSNTLPVQKVCRTI